MIIYKLQNKINGKIYIGKTIKEVEQRIAEHLKTKSLIGKALRKYGLQSFDIFIMDLADDNETLNEKERYWIKFHDCKAPNGYNLTDGGDGFSPGTNLSQETKNKIRNSHLGKPRSEETKKKISIAHKGKKLSQEHRDNASKSLKGRIFSEEHRNKISKALKGKKHTQEQIEANRKGHLGQKFSEERNKKIATANHNRVISLQTRKKLSENAKKQWQEAKEKGFKKFPALVQRMEGA